MLINASNIALLFQGFKGNFNKGLQGAKTHFRDIAMVVPSSTREEKYGWLGQFPKLREWIGDRYIRGLAMHDYAIVNKKFELTIAVQRDKIEDDQYGIYGPLMEEMGKTVAEHPDEIIFSLLSQGFTTVGYDGQNFFDTDHPVLHPDTGEPTSVSNMQAGAEPAWFLLDTSRAIKPLVWQERVPFVFQNLVDPNDEQVFKLDEYLYGIRGRANAGFAPWQLAFGSKAELTAANYEAARVAMMGLRGDEGRPLGLMPNVLVVPPALEGVAMRLLNNGERVETVTIDTPTMSLLSPTNGPARPSRSSRPGWREQPPAPERGVRAGRLFHVQRPARPLLGDPDLFILKDTYEFSASVTVKVPEGDGKHVEQVFKGRFKVLSVDDIQALTKDLSGDQADAEVLRSAWIGWSELVDEKNAPVPFSEDMRDRLLSVPFVRAGAAAAYVRAIGGAKE